MGPPHQVTLYFVAGLGCEKFKLIRGLDALRQYRQVEPVRQANDGAHNRRRLRIAFDI
jgi:hypothetical protein